MLDQPTLAFNPVAGGSVVDRFPGSPAPLRDAGSRESVARAELAARQGSVLARVDQLISTDLERVETILANELASSNAYVRDILQHSTRFRGKRLRPILLLLSARACGEVTEDHRVLAAVVEMIHLATLVHDDVLDEASTRRHVATINSRWNNETSVLFGDYLFTHSFHLASSLPTTYACRMIGKATNRVCEGELTQIHERGNLSLTEETYFDIIDGKTAELCALCGHLAGVYSEQPTAVVAALENYARYLGHAFQIADDLLDLRGNEKQTGKTLGSDLQKQKLTLPLIRLLNTASQADQGEIRKLLQDPAPETRDRLLPFLKSSDAWAYTQAVAERKVADAVRELDILPNSPAKVVLAELAGFAVERSF